MPKTVRSTVARRKSTKSRKTEISRARQVVRAKRSLFKRMVMHPMMTFAILLTGVSLAGLTYQTMALDFNVQAVVAATPLNSGAVITSPKNGAVITAKPVTVTGTCPNTAYVKLLRNDSFSGVAFCDNGTFSIVTDLFVGANDLQAQDYNITDQAGPQTPVVHVTYQPATPTVSSAKSKATTSTAPPLLLTGDYHFSVATTNSSFKLNLTYQFANPPIDTHVNWGDGQKSQVTIPTNQTFQLEHTYKDSGYYPIEVQGTDADGQTVSMQMVAFVKKPGDAATQGSILPVHTSTPNAHKSSFSLGTKKFHWLLYVWPTYLVLVVMMLSFWLGERRELLVLTKHSRMTRHPRVRHT